MPLLLMIEQLMNKITVTHVLMISEHHSHYTSVYTSNYNQLINAKYLSSIKMNKVAHACSIFVIHTFTFDVIAYVQPSGQGSVW